MDPIDPADEREWEIHRAFEKMKKELAAKDAQLCRAREAFRRFLGYFVSKPADSLGPATIPRSHNHRILDCPACARPDRIDVQAAIAALSATGPCQHAEEAKRLSQVNKVYEEQIAESAAVYAERDRLREAVEWACAELHQFQMGEVGVRILGKIADELRRRAKEGKV